MKFTEKGGEMKTLAAYAKNIPNVGYMLEYQHKYWEITKIRVISQETGIWSTIATLVEVDENGKFVLINGETHLSVVNLDEIDYKEV